ncbi:response regulator [Pseudoalteromonas sp. L1]|uniref:response regulator n=1 Tax=Pseudoalteromonas sp. L1 TaxID=195716 RepID=UPI001F16CC9D|nr:response regulator [Pseudoalteromonas sp. L1]
MKNINILIAEDQEDKSNSIVAVLRGKYPDSNFEYSVSYSGTAKKIKNQQFDIIILDMSMPNFDPKPGERPSLKALAGKDIMTKMQYRKVSVPVIVVTQFDIFGRHSDAISIDKLSDDLKKDFPKIFRGCVYYNPQSKSWEQELLKVTSEIING